MALLVTQVFSQKDWPLAGDIDDCWVVAWLQCSNAVAPWNSLINVKSARAYAGDPDDGIKDGGNVDDIMKGISNYTPPLAPLCTPLRGSWTFEKLLPEIKKGRPFCAAVMGNALPKVYTNVAHQVTFFYEAGTGLWCCDPMAPDRSPPYRISEAATKRALYAYGGTGKVYGVLFPTRAKAFPTHPLYVKPTGYTEAQLQAAVAQAISTANVDIARLKTELEAAKQAVLTVKQELKAKVVAFVQSL